MRSAPSLRRRLTSLATIAGLVAASVVTSVGASSVAAAADLPPGTSPVLNPTADQVTADALPTVQVDGMVWSQATIGNTVYAGGKFANARPAGAAAGTNLTPRANLLAYDITTGALKTSFAPPALNGQVLAVAASPDGKRVYAAGDFTTVGGNTLRNRVAAFDATTGALITTFNVNIGSRVRALVATNDTLYVGGQFTSANGQPRSRLAAYAASNGALTGWAPTADYTVNAMVLSPDKSKLIVGGAFAAINGSTVYGLAAIDTANGTLLPFSANEKIQNSGANAAINSLSTDGTTVYGTGYVYGPGGNLEGAFSADPNTGAINWVEDCHGDTYSAWATNAAVYTTSHAHYCGTLGGFPQSDPWSTNQRFALAFSKNATGVITGDPLGYYDWRGTASPSLINWFPDFKTGTVSGQNQAGWNIVGTGPYISVGGEFPQVNGTGQQGLVRFATKPPAPGKSGPVLTGSKFTPSLVSLAKGSVRVAFQANWDKDDMNLTYKVVRNSNTAAPVYTTTATSTYWDRPALGFTDTGLAPGDYRYRLYVIDKDGNQVAGDTAYITVPADGQDPSQYAQTVKNQGANLFWRLGESSGTTAYDWAGFNDGIVGPAVTRGAAGSINGDSTTASTFDGTTGSKVVANVRQAAPTTFSQSAWVKTTSTNGGKIIGFGDSQGDWSSNYDRHTYMTNDGKLMFGVYINGTQTISSGKSYNDGQWHLVTSTLGADGMNLYVDGVRVASRSDITTSYNYTGYWHVGGDNLGGWPGWISSGYLAGDIDDAAIYPTALTADQVLQQYVDSGRPSPIPARPTDAYGAAVYDAQPSLFWRLNESTGRNAADSSRSLNSGTYYNGVTLGTPGALSGGVGTSATFDGNNAMASSDNVFSNPTTYSEEIWFKTTTNRGGKLIGFGNNQSGNSGAYDRHVYMQDDGHLVFGVWTGFANTIWTPLAYNDGNWHHVVATQGGDGMALYVDGVLQGTNGQNQAQGYDGFWKIGGDNTWGSSSAYFDGSLDDAAIYPTVLSADQVRTHYSLGATGALPNKAPTAAFTESTNQLALAVDGSSSSDPDGTVTRYVWEFGDGQTAEGATASHTYAAAGTYPVTLTVYDDKGTNNATTKSVTVTAPPPNAAPTAAFTASANQLALSVDGSSSSDSDGTVAGYSWDFGDGQTAAGATASHTYGQAGTYTVSLTVTDDKGATNTTTKSVTVTAPPANKAPTSSFTTAGENLSLSVDGSGSSDADGSVRSWAWSFGDGGSASGVSASHVYGAAGTYTVSLTVTDDKGATGVSSQQVTVTAPPPNAPPVAAFDVSSAGLTATVDGTSSRDSDGSIQSYEWSFGDGQSDTGATAVHTYGSAGTYQITLKVTDDDGASTSLSKSVTVTAPPPANKAPVAAFTNSVSGLAATFDGGSSSDPDGSVSSWAWDFGDSSAETGRTASHTYLAAGTYPVSLTVTDNQGATNTVTKSVTVTNPATPTAYVTDTFSRAVTGGLGSAETGGAWTLNGSSSLFSVANGTGNLRINTAGSGPLAWLNSVSASDLRGTVDFTYDKASTGGGTYTSVAVRRVGTSDYRFKVRIQPTSVQIQLAKVVNGTETVLRTQTVSGMTWAPGDVLRLGFQAQGAGTTTLSAKVWKTSAAEPAAWQSTVTDAESVLQGPGAVGLQAYLAGSATNAPVVASFDNLSITTIPQG